MLFRLFNPVDSEISVPLKLGNPVATVQLTNLEGSIIEDLTIRGGATRIDLKPKQIVTVRINHKRP